MNVTSWWKWTFVLCNLAGLNGIASTAMVARSASAVVARGAGAATRGVLGMTGSPSKHHIATVGHTPFQYNIWHSDGYFESPSRNMCVSVSMYLASYLFHSWQLAHLVSLLTCPALHVFTYDNVNCRELDFIGSHVHLCCY